MCLQTYKIQNISFPRYENDDSEKLDFNRSQGTISCAFIKLNNNKYWNTISLDGSVPDDKLREWIDHS
jgi:predicted DNA-binding protein (MmcQ/YjbR family)